MPALRYRQNTTFRVCELADHGGTLSLKVHLAMECWSTRRNNFHQGVDMRCSLDNDPDLVFLGLYFPKPFHEVSAAGGCLEGVYRNLEAYLHPTTIVPSTLKSS